MAAPGLDLELPPFQPGLTAVLSQADCAGASFAIYSMVESVGETRLEEISAIPQEEWEEVYMDTRCVKPAVPTANFAGKALRDIVAAHIAMDKELTPREGGSPAAGWWPHVFVIVTSETIEDHGLLLVYAFEPLADPEEQDEEDEVAEEAPKPTMGKFFFKPESMFDILSAIALQGEDLDYVHETYDMDQENADEDDDEEEDDEEEE